MRVRDEDPKVDAARYQRLLYLTITRLEITRAVNNLHQFMTKPKQVHMDDVARVLRYLKTTPGQGILLSSNDDLKLEAYCDAYWGGCPLTRRSCKGYLITLRGSPISWGTKRQEEVAKSLV